MTTTSKILIALAIGGVAISTGIIMTGRRHADPGVTPALMSSASLPAPAPAPTASALRLPFDSSPTKLSPAQASAALGELATIDQADVERLALSLKSPHSDVQCAAIAALAKTEPGRTQIAVTYVTLPLEAQREAERQATGADAGPRDLAAKLADSATSGLTSAIADVRLSSVRALQRTKSAAPENLARLLLVESDTTVLSEMVSWAGTVKGPGVHQALLQLAAGKRDASVRQHALENLIRTGSRTDDASLAVACTALSDAAGEVRLGAVIALGYQGWDRLPESARQQVKQLAAADAYTPTATPKGMTSYPVRDAAKMLLLAANQPAAGATAPANPKSL